MIERQISHPKLMEQCTDEELAQARDYLLSYRLCEKMLCLRGYERKRSAQPDMPTNDNLFLQMSDQLWEMRMFEIKSLINDMHNGREKMVLYYHYVRGESVECAARLIGISRRTAYRMHEKGLAMVVLARRKKAEALADCQKNDRISNE